MKLAVFVDQIFWFDGTRFSTDEAFIKFVTAFAPYVEQLVLFGRVAGEAKTEQYQLDPAKTHVCALPFYKDTYTLWQEGSTIIRKTCAIFAKQIMECDLVWLCVPHPLSVLFTQICRYKKKPFFMLVRQNLIEMVRYQNRGAKKIIAVSIASVLEKWFQALAKKHVTFTVGREMYRRYKTDQRALVFETACSLISHEDIAVSRTLQGVGEDTRTLHLLYVGRLDPGKGIEYLLEALRMLIVDNGRAVQLHIVGKGRMQEEYRQRVKALRLERWVEFHGYLAHGHELLELYRTASVFVLPSLSEGIPQVLLEAMACGTPVVATKVGGIPDLISDGVHGLLVDPGEPQQIVQAVLKVGEDVALHQRLREHAFEKVAHHTLEVERDRMIATLHRFCLWPQTEKA